MTLEWRFLTNHARVLSYIDRQDGVTARAISDFLGISEPTVREIISHLVGAGYISKRLEGRVNRYRINAELPMRSREFRNITVSALLDFLGTAQESKGQDGPVQSMVSCPASDSIRPNPMAFRPANAIRP
jgi:DNA-binding Lrp family transcriptional regulator